MKVLTAIPIFNEERHLEAVLQEVRRYGTDLLVIDDGSTDGTAAILARQPDVAVVSHPQNRGYGAALISAFARAVDSNYDVLITMDCDGQHEPSRIPVLLEALDSKTDVVSGSRYLRDFRQTSLPTPQDRRQINQIITSELNETLGIHITDAFCGFKAYRRAALEKLHITETGWGMPLQLWVQAAFHCLRIKEVGVPRLYLDPNRSFGNGLDDANERLSYYRRVIEDALAEETLRMLPVYLPRLKAPRNHGELLAYPPLADVGTLLRDNRDRFGAGSLLDRPLVEIRDLARREILTAARDYLHANGEPVPEFSSATWLVGGHQPELFHPGVWVKNFILQFLARGHGATPLNLVVDNDLAKSAVLRVPAGDRVLSVPFDEAGSDVPFEERLVKDEDAYRTLPERLAPSTRGWPFRPWVNDVWAEMLRAAPTTPLLGERIVRARRRLERSMGIQSLEVPLSAVCRTESFAWFACALLADLSRFVDNYNAAVHAYRRRHDLKSKNHPVPDLARQGESFETPFWVWRTDAPRRQRLFAVRDSGGVQLFSGITPLAHLRGNSTEWVDQWQTLERQGIKIRTRALSTTLFSRLVLADLFVHGIGGGKYDEVTDTILDRHFEREPPHYLVATATLLLPFPRTGGLAERWHELKRQERDCWYNPQRYLHAINPATEELKARKRTALAMPEMTHHDRVARFHRLLQAAAELRPLVAEQIANLDHDRREIEIQLRREEISAARDYAFCLYPEEMLRSYFQSLKLAHETDFGSD